jgi:hypothetical protein
MHSHNSTDNYGVRGKSLAGFVGHNLRGEDEARVMATLVAAIKQSPRVWAAKISNEIYRLPVDQASAEGLG